MALTELQCLGLKKYSRVLRISDHGLVAATAIVSSPHQHRVGLR